MRIIDPDNAEKGNWQNKFKKAIKTKSGLYHVMYIMLEEETNSPSLVVAIQPPLPLVPSKNPPLPPPPVPNPEPKTATADVGTLDAVLLAISTKFQINSILNRK